MSGRVVSAATGLPIRRALVSLRARGGASRGVATLTDDDGAFTFPGVPGGRYDLRATKPRYVDMAYGARRPGGTGRAIEIAEGQRLEDVALSMATAGVITGRVVDDAGEPVVGASVMVLRHQPMGGHGLVAMGSPRHTDDTGTYRLFGLTPGRYYVSARADEYMGFSMDVLDTHVTGLLPTFHPSTPTPSVAQAVHVTAGTEVLADITLVAGSMVKITGSVVDASGRPALSGIVMAQVDDEIPFLGSRSVSPIGKDGTFTLSGVPPGDYVLIVRGIFDTGEAARIAMSGRSGEDGYTMPLSIGADGVEDLRIVVPALVDVPGRVVFEGGRPDEGRPLWVNAQIPGGRMGMTRAEVQPDGRFVMRLRPGAWEVTSWPGPGWMVKEITFRGRAVEPGSPVDIGSDAGAGARIEITATNQLTRVSGTVVDESRQPVRDYHVIFFPRDLGPISRSGPKGVHVQPGRADGRFEMSGLWPGEYLAFAVTDFEPGGYDRDVLESYRSAATPVQVAFGQPQTVTLTLAALP